MIQHYESQGKVARINADRDPEEIYKARAVASCSGPRCASCSGAWCAGREARRPRTSANREPLEVAARTSMPGTACCAGPCVPSCLEALASAALAVGQTQQEQRSQLAI